MSNKIYHDLRETYGDPLLDRVSLDRNPFNQLDIWLQEANDKDIQDSNAMCLCTRNKNGLFRQRQVLLKEVFEEKLVFYSNYQSQKAQDLEFDKNVSVNFFWRDLSRQITVAGTIEKISKEHSQKYFQTRPRKSQIAAWASEQSTVLPSRDHLLKRFDEIEKKFKGQDIPLPDFWGGFAILPVRFEFWQGVRNRLHDRFEYLKEEQQWKIQRLSP